jgi:plasmid stability protein
MAEMLVRQLDDDAIERLKVRRLRSDPHFLQAGRETNQGARVMELGA